MVKDPNKIKMGKKSRASGADFERRVRKDLEDKGWIVDKWSNNVELGNCENCSYENEEHFKDGQCPILGQEKQYLEKEGKLIPSKHKFRGTGIPMAMGTGFPDFVVFRFVSDTGSGGGIIDDAKESPINHWKNTYAIIGIECKINGYLDKIEKEKCKWYLDHLIFSQILIASKTKVKNKIVIKYENFNGKS